MKKIIIIACTIGGLGVNAMGQINRPMDGIISYGTENVINFKKSSTTILTVKENGQIMRRETPIDELPAEELIKIIKELVNSIASRK